MERERKWLDREIGISSGFVGHLDFVRVLKRNVNAMGKRSKEGASG